MKVHPTCFAIWILLVILPVVVVSAQPLSEREHKRNVQGHGHSAPRHGNSRGYHWHHGYSGYRGINYGGVYSAYPFAPNYFYDASPYCAETYSFEAYSPGPYFVGSAFGYFPPAFSRFATPMKPMVDPFANRAPVVLDRVVAPMLPRFDAENFAHRGVPAGAAPPAAMLVPGGGVPGGGEIAAEPGFDGLNEIRRRVSVLKPSTPQSRARADRLISQGDAAFANQKLARANGLYRDAIAKAPDYAACHFRLAHSYVGSRQYTLALKSLMIALELSGSAKRGGFSLEDMYQGDQFIRDKHFETLLDASKREPDDGGLRLLLGFFLQYDGKPLQAREHFTSANEIAGLHQSYTRYFLPTKPVAEL